MLRILISFLLAALSLATLAQHPTSPYAEYHLPDGRVVEARLIDQVSRDSILLETTDGERFTASASELPRRPQHEAKPRPQLPPREPVAPAGEQAVFGRGARLFEISFRTHLSGAGEDGDPEAGIALLGAFGWSPVNRLSVSGVTGLMTVKAGTEERLFPLLGRVAFQANNRIRAAVDLGYAYAPEIGAVLEARGGPHGAAELAFELVGPTSRYSSRVGLGLLAQRVTFNRLETLQPGPFSGQQPLEQFVSRDGWVQRFHLTFSHAWRLRPQKLPRH